MSKSKKNDEKDKIVKKIKKEKGGGAGEVNNRSLGSVEQLRKKYENSELAPSANEPAAETAIVQSSASQKLCPSENKEPILDCDNKIYKEQALIFHPDRNRDCQKEAAEKFNKLREFKEKCNSNVSTNNTSKVSTTQPENAQPVRKNALVTTQVKSNLNAQSVGSNALVTTEPVTQQPELSSVASVNTELGPTAPTNIPSGTSPLIAQSGTSTEPPSNNSKKNQSTSTDQTKALEEARDALQEKVNSSSSSPSEEEKKGLDDKLLDLQNAIREFLKIHPELLPSA
jgi:hypothetical protein